MKHISFLSLALLLSTNSAIATELPLSGTCGDGCLYEITTINGQQNLRVYNDPNYNGTANIASGAFAKSGNATTGDYVEYYDNTTFDKITIDGDFSTIGNRAFWHNGAREVVFNGNINNLGSGSFEFNNLTSVDLPETLKNISSQAFYGNRMTSIVIPDSVISVGNYAFNQWTTLLNVYMSDTLESLGGIIKGKFYTFYPFGNGTDLSIICKGDITKCQSLLKKYRPNNSNTEIDLSGNVIAATYEQCNGQYFWDGISCVREPDESKRTCCQVCADLGGYCSRIRYTLPEADAATSDDNENMIEWIFW